MACDAAFEKRLRRSGYRAIAGVDEVGRGAIAGPVVAAAVILDLKDVPEGINDSKRLSKPQRNRLCEEIRARAREFSIARVEPDEIDRINIHRASLLAMRLAIKALRRPIEYVLIDGKFRVPDLACPQESIIKGDTLSVSIAAASILAKVMRDGWMSEYDKEYPGYGFTSHVGYGTRAHFEAVARLGPSPVHRKTFRGVCSYQAVLNLSI